MNKESHFDAIASGYDLSFSHSLIGEEQRMASRRCLRRFLAGKGPLKILEINCGTGEDAIWLASLGHTVIATDQSAAMIQEAERKMEIMTHETDLPSGRVHFMVCGFAELEAAFQGQEFDLIFSNFAGLNCVSPAELSLLGGQFHGLLRRHGHLATVLFGKYSWMETFYFLLQSDARKAFRRWRNKEALARLEEGVYQPVHYYSVGYFARILDRFQLLEKYPVGLFIPPSYMEGIMQRRRRLFRCLVRLEGIAGQLGLSSELADHMYILLKKKDL